MRTHKNTTPAAVAGKEAVRIRTKALANGNQSIYLDTYRDGKRHYEFLRLYIIQERTDEDRAKNVATMQLANAIKAKRIVELQNNEFGFDDHTKAERTPIIPYIEAIAESRRTGAARNNILSMMNHLCTYARCDRLTIADITQKWIVGFREYLQRRATSKSKHYAEPLRQNTQKQHWSAFKQCMRRAYIDGLLQSDPLLGVEGIKGEETARAFLTLEELKALFATPAPVQCNKQLCRAFLFSCLTGLRFSDIKKLTWAEVDDSDKDAPRLIFRQRKTRGMEYMDITPQALELMGEGGKPTELVFPSLPVVPNDGGFQRRWMEAAGIKKHITFHSGRHTFAVLMIELGVDIYTISKLLGHRDIATTQVYAKVLDKTKRAAVDKIPRF